MLLSEHIAECARLIAEHGDIPVLVRRSDRYGDHDDEPEVRVDPERTPDEWAIPRPKVALISS